MPGAQPEASTSPVEDTMHFVHADLHIEACHVVVGQAVDVAQDLWCRM